MNAGLVCFVNQHAKDKRAFWNAVEETVAGLPDACGCYVFLVGTRAWYIGKAEKQTFRMECFSAHKLNQYNKALQYVQSVPRLIFLVKITPAGYAAKHSKNGHKDIELLEKLLIGVALRKNPDILNVKDTKLLREMHVPGLINTGKGEGKAHAVQALRKAVGS